MEFIKQFKRIVNTGQSRAIVLSGNIYDLFESGDDWVPLIYYLANECKVEPGQTKGITQVIYRLNNPIEVRGDFQELEAAYAGIASTKLQDRLDQSGTNTLYALQLLRQLTEAMRLYNKRRNNLLVIIEAADIRIPECELSRLSLVDRQSVAVINDWFCDPAFMAGGDTVVLLAESRSGVHHRIARLPQVVSVEISLPDLETRKRYIEQGVLSAKSLPDSAVQEISEQTSGLSIHALRQLMLAGDYTTEAIAKKVESYMTGQLGEGVVEFKRPTQKMKDVIGFCRIKEFMMRELIPGFQEGTISGAAVGGPIGGGKTFICEAVAAELGIPVVTLKNIRSKWYGETDEIFERLRRLLESFHRIVIFVDEADTQFGDVGSDEQATERRLTGKIQAMMSDVALKGKVIWFLMTARIHLLSPDIRRPGRMDLIIPILDPEGNDREQFIKWALGNLVCGFPPSNTISTGGSPDADWRDRLNKITVGWSAAAFSMLKAQIKLKKCQSVKEAVDVAHDILMPDIGLTRRYQTIQALLNCTRRSLIEGDVDSLREGWKKELTSLEAMGVR